jgi:thioredoxin 2
MNTVLIRCYACGVLNRVPEDKLRLKPKCGKCKTFLSYPHKPVDITADTFQKEVLSYPGVVLVDFWSPLCVHCQNLNLVIEKLAREKAGKLKIAKVDTQFQQELAFRFGVLGVPTLILYQNGREINKTTGALQKQQLENWIDSSIRA